MKRLLTPPAERPDPPESHACGRDRGGLSRDDDQCVESKRERQKGKVEPELLPNGEENAIALLRAVTQTLHDHGIRSTDLESRDGESASLCRRLSDVTGCAVDHPDQHAVDVFLLLAAHAPLDRGRRYVLRRKPFGYGDEQH